MTRLRGDTALVVGNSGTILRSTDGGATWRALSSGVAGILRGVAVGNDRQAVVVGDGGVILRGR